MWLTIQLSGRLVLLRLRTIGDSGSFFQRVVEDDNRMGLALVNCALTEWYLNDWPLRGLCWYASVESPNASRVTLDLRIHPVTGEMGGARVHFYQMAGPFPSTQPTVELAIHGVPCFDISPWPIEARTFEPYDSEPIEVQKKMHSMKIFIDSYSPSVFWTGADALGILLAPPFGPHSTQCVVNEKLSLLFDEEQILTGLILSSLSVKERDLIENAESALQTAATRRRVGWQI